MSHKQILWIGVALSWIAFLVILDALPLPKEFTLLGLAGLGMIMWGMTEEKKK